MTLPASGWIPFGIIGRAHGVRGEVRLVPMRQCDALPGKITAVRLVRAGAEPLMMTLQSVRPTPGAWLVSFREIYDRTAAQALAGATLEVAESGLPPLGEGELYLYELIGAAAVDERGIAIGVVEGVLDNNGQDVLVLRSPEGAERLLPVAEETLIHFDRERRVVELRMPAGLWDEA